MELSLVEREEGGRARREREIVRWVARLGAVSVGQIGSRFGVGRSVAYELVRRLVCAGMLERTQTLAGDPTLIGATTAGIAYAGLGLPTPTIRIGEVDHWLACADVAIELERRHGLKSVLTDRELRFQERLTGKPIASARRSSSRCALGKPTGELDPAREPPAPDALPLWASRTPDYVAAQPESDQREVAHMLVPIRGQSA